jgi:hypothetical protein
MSVQSIGDDGVTHNHDIESLVRRIHRFVKEITRSQSSGVSDFGSFDKVRLTTYLDAAERYFKWVTAQPQLDLPETHPQTYDLPALPEVGEIENDDIIDLVRLFVKMRDEIVHSQSSRMGSGLMIHDQDRFKSLLAKMRSFLKDYVDDTAPLDLPESSPRGGMPLPGNQGV